jgi:hypothetical protein
MLIISASFNPIWESKIRLYETLSRHTRHSFRIPQFCSPLQIYSKLHVNHENVAKLKSRDPQPSYVRSDDGVLRP